MSFYGRSSRFLIEQMLPGGKISDSQIVECDLSNLVINKTAWVNTDLRDLHANDILFHNSHLEKSNFFRSSLMRARFLNSSLDNMTLDGLTLIKSLWRDCSIHNATIRNNCLQRTQVFQTRIISSLMLDFEALEAFLDNCLFAHSTFRISYGSGMNGFSSAKIKNCIFYHCRFEGFPLRGAVVSSSAFIHCSGEIGDEMECSNVAGLGLGGCAALKRLLFKGDAEKLLERLAS